MPRFTWSSADNVSDGIGTRVIFAVLGFRIWVGELNTLFVSGTCNRLLSWERDLGSGVTVPS
jgi:hypothetical protein